ncbi:MAG TPA: hypothetical protein VGG19_00335 [Tepidisphaeraceae bacterium]|jgi:hypothetical protein
MAKMFYTMDETKSVLGKNEEEVKQLTREGRLREYRDGAKLMYKTDQVDALKNELAATGGGDELGLAGAESGAPIGLVDSKGGSGSVIGLADSTAKEDSVLAADLGASGTGIPSPGRSGSRTGTATGITVFGMEDGDRADPSAQTAASPALGSEMGLESVGSGSGLLDLTRESDDTSLGAELLDEMQPGKGKRGTRTAGPVVADMPSGTEATLAGAESAVVRSTPAPMTMVEAPDSLAPALGGASLGAALVLLFACVALVSACLGYDPAFLDPMVKDRGMLIISAFLLAPVVIFFIAGLFIGKAVRR